MRSTRIALLLALSAVACAPTSVAAPTGPPTVTATPPVALRSVPVVLPTSTPLTGLPARPEATIAMPGWGLLPNSLEPGVLVLRTSFPTIDDAGPGRPRARLRSTRRTVDLVHLDIKANPSLGLLPPQWEGTLPLAGAKVGTDAVEIVVRLRDGSDVVAGERRVTLSEPEYVVWTLDFEGDAASNETMDNTWDVARSFGVPMTIMWNPRVWTTDQVTPARADAMAQWTKNIASQGMAEVALHLHAWTDFVRAAGVVPRTAPSWAGRSDGYDVPLTAFDESETKKLLDHALALMNDHGLPKPTTFRAGGLFANAANLRAVAAAGFTVDTSATPAGGFGRLLLPWTLPRDAQPYRPSRTDANVPGDLPLLEVPNIAGNTFSLDTRTIAPVIAADLAMLAPAGQPAASRRALTLVSHPGTVDATERTAIEALFRAFEPYRYDRDNGPVRFVTLTQLEKAFN